MGHRDEKATNYISKQRALAQLLRLKGDLTALRGLAEVEMAAGARHLHLLLCFQFERRSKT